MSGALIAIKMPLHIKIANKINTTAQPMNPSSSPKIENIKSLCGSGIYRYFCLLSPNPTPNNPPEPIAYKLCITCHPSPVASFHGSKNVMTLCNLYGAAIISAVSIGTPAVAPVAAKCVNLHPAIIIIIEQIPIITTDELKCGSSISNPIIGSTNTICFKNPFPYLSKSSLFFTNIPA